MPAADLLRHHEGDPWESHRPARSVVPPTDPYGHAIKDAYAIHIINVARRTAAIDTTGVAAALGDPTRYVGWLINKHGGLSDRHKAGAVFPGKSSHLGTVTVRFPTGSQA